MRARIETTVRTWGFRILLVLAAVAGVSITVARTHTSYFWQDDFIFISQAREMGFSLQTFLTPLFTHFTPFTWLYHLVIAWAGDSWLVAFALMILTVLLASVLLGTLMRMLGAARSVTLFAVFLWASSLAHMRLVAWWSAFVQDVPHIPILLLMLILWIRFLRSPKLAVAVVICLLQAINCLAYELGYLAPVFMVAVAIFSQSTRGLRMALQRRNFLLLVIATALSAATYLWSRQFVGTPPAPFTPGSFTKFLLAYWGAADGPVLIGLFPQPTWIIVVITWCVLLIFVALCLVFRVFNVSFLLAWAVPYFVVASALAYGRSGLDAHLPFPKYPMDLQYHPLTLLWTTLFLGISATRIWSRVRATPLFRRLPVPSWFARSLSLLIVILVTLAASQVSPERVQLQKKELGVSRTVQAALAGLPEDAYAVNDSVSFVLKQTGYYSQLTNVGQVLLPDKARVLAGHDPYTLSSDGTTRPLIDDPRFGPSEQIEILPQCLELSAKNPNQDVSFPAVPTGSIIYAKITARAHSVRAVGIFTRDADGSVGIVDLGLISGDATSFAQEVPKVPGVDRDVASGKLASIQFQMTSGPIEICIADAKVFRPIR